MPDPYEERYQDPRFEFSSTASATLMRQGLEDRAHDERGGPQPLALQQIPAEGVE